MRILKHCIQMHSNTINEHDNTMSVFRSEAQMELLVSPTIKPSIAPSSEYHYCYGAYLPVWPTSPVPV